MAKEKNNLLHEILPSAMLGGYQAYRWAPNSDENPTVIWNSIRENPWAAISVFSDMEDKDAAVFSALDTRKNNVLSKPRNIIPASEKRSDKRIAAFVEETLKHYFADFDSFLYEALDAIGMGVAVGEIIFDESADRVFIKEVKFKPQQLFSFGESDISGITTASLAYSQTGPLQLRQGVLINEVAGTELPADKFFVFSFRPKHGNRWGTPVHRKAFWPSWIKRSSIRQWLRYQEKGTGSVVAKYPGSAGAKEQETALDAATAIVEENAVAIPDKFELEFHDTVRTIGSSHKELVDDFCNAEIMRIYLGQALTGSGAGGGGSRARDEVAERVTDTISEADCKSLMQAVNRQLIPHIVALNFGPTAQRPRWVIEYEQKEDLDSKAKRYGLIKKEIGIELSKQQIREDLQLEEPRDKEDSTAPPEDVTDDETTSTESITSRKSISSTSAQFAEDVKKKSQPGSGTPSSSRTQRFMRFRPSMIEFSDE